MIVHTGGFGGFFLLELRQTLFGPIGQEFLIQHADKLMPVPPGHFAVTQTSAAHRASDSVGTASEAVVGVPQLVFLTPAGLFQRIRAEYQHLTGVILLGTVTDAMLRAEQAQLLIRFPIEVYKAIQYGGVASDGDLGVVPLILRNIAPRRPLLVGSAETPVPGKLLQSGGQHPFRALVAICLCVDIPA